MVPVAEVVQGLRIQAPRSNLGYFLFVSSPSLVATGWIWHCEMLSVFAMLCMCIYGCNIIDSNEARTLLRLLEAGRSHLD